MGKAQIVEEWWQEPNAGDQSMEDEHEDFWQDVLDNVLDVDLKGKKILDFGCNQGGFLRRLYEITPFSSAVGVDLAKKSIDKANQRKGNVPAQYYALDNIDSLDKDFDYALSTAVIFLIDDLKDHARQMFGRLKPGGAYYATYPDYSTEPEFATVRQEIDRHAAVKCSPRSLDDVVGAFESAGFKVQVKKIIPEGYIPVSSGNRWYGSVKNNIEFWYWHRYAFKCVKPT